MCSAEIDENDDGQVSFAEFLELMHHVRLGRTPRAAVVLRVTEAHAARAEPIDPNPAASEVFGLRLLRHFTSHEGPQKRTWGTLESGS
jgi:hypothetical protein